MLHQYKQLAIPIKIALLSFIIILSGMLVIPHFASAAIPAGCPGGPDGPKNPSVDCNAPENQASGEKRFPSINTGDPVVSGDKCGSGDTETDTSLNYGCKRSGNGIVDVLYAIIRFLTAGVGLVVIASIVVAGIQYTSSRGDPNLAAKAIERVRNSVIALILYIFTFVILNWLVPGGIL